MATTDALAATGLNTTKATASTVATKTLTQTYDQFITLLTAQLKNQNPLDPMKPEEFTQQLVQFASVEQSISTNKNLEKLLSVQTGTQMAMAVSYIGTTITSPGSTTNLLAGGTASYGYNLPLAAQTTQISIFNEAGQTVFSTNGEITKGDHTFVWDGTDGNGNALPAGKYTASISAKDGGGKDMSGITTTISGIVTGIESNAGVVQLMMGKVAVPIDKVTNVSAF
jgi:flagellar basal-body rod modification protein FlgD